MVVDKPVGVAAHPSPGWTGPTVIGGLAAAGHRVSTSGAEERQGVVHRLDVGTSGLMVVAKSERAYTVLKDAFRERTVDKRYHTLVQGQPDPLTGTVDAPIDRHPTSAYKFAVVAGGRDSVTHYETLEAFRHATLLEIHLETGRTHQIRVHMAALRHPCVGDVTYGADPTLSSGSGWSGSGCTPCGCRSHHPADGRWVQLREPVRARPAALALDRVREAGWHLRVDLRALDARVVPGWARRGPGGTGGPSRPPPGRRRRCAGSTSDTPRHGALRVVRDAPAIGLLAGRPRCWSQRRARAWPSGGRPRSSLRGLRRRRPAGRARRRRRSRWLAATADGTVARARAAPGSPALGLLEPARRAHRRADRAARGRVAAHRPHDLGACAGGRARRRPPGGAGCGRRAHADGVLRRDGRAQGRRGAGAAGPGRVDRAGCAGARVVRERRGDRGRRGDGLPHRVRLRGGRPGRGAGGRAGRAAVAARGARGGGGAAREPSGGAAGRRPCCPTSRGTRPARLAGTGG